MQLKHNFTVVHHILYDLRDSDLFFNEYFVIMRKDFTQTLFIVRKENRAMQINVSISSFFLWFKIKILHLYINMRVQSSVMNENFIKFIKFMFY